MGHIVQMEDDRLPRELSGGIDGLMRRKRWIQDMEEDLGLLRARSGKQVVMDQRKWSWFVMEAKTHCEL